MKMGILIIYKIKNYIKKFFLFYIMYLIPLVRTNRAIAASLLYPQHPIQAIAISEIFSLIAPFLNPKMYSKILALTICMMYQPNFSHFFIQNYQKTQNYYYQAEISSSLLFILTLAIQYI
tara:strand:- start:1944 stop:2303 length:360 start_codon:yes stop_codon:yes gene_type:complete